MIVSNASPLMYLAKIGKLDLLKELFKEIIVPKEVYEEIVVKGKEEGFLDAYVVEKAVNEKWIKVEEVRVDRELERFAPEIDSGEIAVISLARKIKPSLVLIDDASARIIAEGFGFNIKGTLYVLLIALKKKAIEKKEIKDLINRLVRLGFRISHELYGEVLKEIDNA